MLHFFFRFQLVVEAGPHLFGAAICFSRQGGKFAPLGDELVAAGNDCVAVFGQAGRFADVLLELGGVAVAKIGRARKFVNLFQFLNAAAPQAFPKYRPRYA